MSNGFINDFRKLLLLWIADGEKKSYESIKKSCTYLDQAHKLNLGDTAMWVLFYPLFRTGIVDYAGNDYYQATPEVSISRNGLYIYTGISQNSEHEATPYPGFFRTTSPDKVARMKQITFNALSVLKSTPSVKQIVDSFPKSVENLSEAEYYCQ